MRYYITPSHYPDHEINIAHFRSGLISFCSHNDILLQALQSTRGILEWRLLKGEEYLEGVIAYDKVSIEFRGSSHFWLAKFSFFACLYYPALEGVYLLNEELDQVYALNSSTSLEDFVAFFRT